MDEELLLLKVAAHLVSGLMTREEATRGHRGAKERLQEDRERRQEVSPRMLTFSDPSGDSLMCRCWTTTSVSSLTRVKVI